MVSATEIRNSVSKRVERSREFRAGVIYACYNTFDFVHPVIDVAIMNEDESMVLLGRKKDEHKFRFVGGFADVTDQSLEQSVRREAYEETGLEIGDIQYITSLKINDWRYRNDKERSVMTSFFKAKKIFGGGSEKANDDIVEVKWFNIDRIDATQIVDEHFKLLNILKGTLKPVS
jgi:bifunctional NMN adenylyltransferase/nudix hydrolase